MFHHIPPAFHPVFLNVICLIACLGTYFQAKEEHNGQIKDGNIPFISDLGKEKIAGALFSLFFSFYIFIAFNVITIRFEQVKSKYRFNDGRCLQVANVGIYGTGLMACTGQWMFTNFKEEKGDMLMLNAHMAGKWIAYSMSFLYVLMQSLLSAFWKEVEGRSLLVIIIRAFFSALHLALLIAYIALQENYMKTMFNQNNINDNDAAVIDWILILIPSLFTLTFIPEFYKFKTKFKIEYKDGGAIYGTFSQGDATYLGQIPGRGSIEEPSTSLISAAENQMAAWRLSKTGIFIGIFVICILQFICSFVYMFLLDKNSTVVICNGYSQILEDEPPSNLDSDTNGNNNFQLHINRRTALLHGHFRSNKSYLTIGIPTVARHGVNYLDSTIDSLLRQSTVSERDEIVVVVYLADSNQTWVHQTGERLKQKYYRYLESGFLQVFHYKEQVFPDFSKVPRTFNDSLDRVAWRSKQNIDYAFMFMYCKNISYYYMQLEDDVLAMPNYFSNIRFFVSSANFQKSWFCLEFSSLGFLGKLVRNSDLQEIANFLLMFYWHQPGDLLLKYLIHINTQFDDIIRKPSLFQHKGVISSLTGKRQYLTDSSVKQTFSRKRFYNLNPKADVSTSIETFEDHTAEKAYDLSDDYFWGMTPKEGDQFVIKFHQSENITRIYIGLGLPQRSDDIFKACEVKVSSGDCEKWTIIGTIKASDFDTEKLKINLQFNIKCILLNVVKNQTTWVVVREISIFRKGDVVIENPSFVNNKMMFSRQEIEKRMKQNNMYAYQMHRVRMEEIQRQQLAKMNADVWLKKIRQLPNFVPFQAPVFKPNFLQQINKNIKGGMNQPNNYFHKRTRS